MGDTWVVHHRLRQELALGSQRERSPTAVTMVVTANVGRLGMLPGLCASWGGVVSAAVYVAHLAAMPAAERAAAAARAAASVRDVFSECDSRLRPPSWNCCCINARII